MLTDKQVKNAKPMDKRYELKDGGGLVLDVTTNGVKTWRYRYYSNGKNYKLMLGAYADQGKGGLSLKEARDLRDEAKKKLIIGSDPAEKKRSSTFSEVFREWHRIAIKGTFTDKYAYNVELRINPLIEAFGHKKIKEVTAVEILAALRQLEERGTIDLAHRARQVCDQVFRYAIGSGLTDRNPARDLQGLLRSRKTKHYPRITDPAQVGQLLRDIDRVSVFLRREMLKFHALTFVRPVEIRHAEWKEIEWDKQEWRIPASKMKSRQAHIVPLSRQAMEILSTVAPYTKHANKYIFPTSPTQCDKAISDATEAKALRKLGYSREIFTPHGFRGMASTLLHENRWDSVLIEKQLSHTIGSSVAQAYNDAEYLDERRTMMQWWADYLDRLAQENTTPQLS